MARFTKYDVEAIRAKLQAGERLSASEVKLLNVLDAGK